MYSRINLLLVLIILFTIFSSKLSFSNTDRNIQITDIIVQNNQRIDKETILSYLNIEPGDKVNFQILNKIKLSLNQFIPNTNA
jgi:outer membrane protein assembly factor BamA